MRVNMLDNEQNRNKIKDDIKLEQVAFLFYKPKELVDLKKALDLYYDVFSILVTQEAQNLVIDLSQTEKFGLAGIDTLHTIQMACQNLGGRLLLLDVNPSITDTLSEFTQIESKS